MTQADTPRCPLPSNNMASHSYRYLPLQTPGSCPVTACPVSTVTTQRRPGPHFPSIPNLPPQVSLNPRAHTIQQPQISRTVPPMHVSVLGQSPASHVLHFTLRPCTDPCRRSNTIMISRNVATPMCCLCISMCGTGILTMFCSCGSKIATYSVRKTCGNL